MLYLVDFLLVKSVIDIVLCLFLIQCKYFVKKIQHDQLVPPFNALALSKQTYDPTVIVGNGTELEPAQAKRLQ